MNASVDADGNARPMPHYDDPAREYRTRFEAAGTDREALLALVDELGGLGSKGVRETLTASEVRARVRALETAVQDVRGQEISEWARVKLALLALPLAYDFRRRMAEALGVSDHLPQ